MMMMMMIRRYQDRHQQYAPSLQSLLRYQQYRSHSLSWFVRCCCSVTLTTFMFLWLSDQHHHHHHHHFIPVIHVHAWGRTGHEMVGNIASSLLSNHTLQQIHSLLNLSSTNYTNHHDDSTSSTARRRTSSTIHYSSSSTSTEVGGDELVVAPPMQSYSHPLHTNDCVEYCTPLAIVADWADQVRFYYKWSSPLHYIDIRDDIIVVPTKGCPVVVPVVPKTDDNNNNSNNNDMVNDETTNRKHYSKCYFNYTRDCPNNMCVAGAIMNYTTHLYEGYAAKTEDRIDDKTSYDLRDSLKFLIHFMGDIHQPLHCSRTTDRGGNNIHVQYHPNHHDYDNKFNHVVLVPPSDVAQGQHRPKLLRSSMSSSSSSSLFLHHSSLNLHAVWDDRIIETILQRDFSNSRNAFEMNLLLYIHDIRINHPHIYYKNWLHCPDAMNIQCVTVWGEESFNLAMQYAYANVDHSEIIDGTILTEEYYLTRHPIVRQQLAIAAVRLATTLEHVFRVPLQ